MRTRIRDVIFPELRNRVGAPPNAGVYQSTVSEIEHVHCGYLFNGAVEACDGNSIPHDTLPLTIVQIGVSLVSYRGGQGSWVHRLYRRDLRVSGSNPVNEPSHYLKIAINAPGSIRKATMITSPALEEEESWRMQNEQCCFTVQAPVGEWVTAIRLHMNY